jgi:hypothetical protein
MTPSLPLRLAALSILTLSSHAALHAQDTKRAEAVEILGVESWTRERFTDAVKEHCKGKW